MEVLGQVLALSIAALFLIFGCIPIVFHVAQVLAHYKREKAFDELNERRVVLTKKFRDDQSIYHQ